jgi:hypothetical protein
MTVENEFFGKDDPPADAPASELDPDPDAGDSLSSASASRSMMERPSLRMLARAGGRALRRYPALVLALYVVQLAMSAAAALIMMMLLYSALGDRPAFARGLDGDLPALLLSLGSDPQLLPTLVWIGLAAVLAYSVVSWFMTAGLIAVLLDSPTGGREIVRWFGAAGAANFFPFLRLALWSALPHAAVVAVAGFGLGWIEYQMVSVFEPGEALKTLAFGLSPALLLHWIVATAIDYARVDLVRNPGMSSLRGLLRGFAVVVRHRLALVHTLFYGLVFAGACAVYGWSAAGAGVGLLGVVALRRVTSLVRMTAHVALIAGQVELAYTTMNTPLGRR